jgi:hypothetical protein
MRTLSILFIALAIILITLGRLHVRRARASPSRSRNSFGWLLTFVGFLCMIAGVVLW